MADDQDLDFEQRSELRKRLAYPIMRAFEKWIVAYHPKALPGGRMSKALSYTYNLFERLSRYHLDGRYLPDNNLAENAIRPLAVGRKGVFSAATMMQLRMQLLCMRCWDAARLPMCIPENG